MIEQADRLFRRGNLRFLTGQGTRLAFPDATFECVGAFQVIEHVPGPDLPAFLREIVRVLTPGGVFVASTLNIDHNRKGNPHYRKADFHEHEFTAGEYRALLEGVFPLVELYGLYPRWRCRLYQRLKKWGLDRWGAPVRNPVARFFAADLTTDDFVLRRRCGHRAIDLIAVCRTRSADAAASS